MGIRNLDYHHECDSAVSTDLDLLYVALHTLDIPTYKTRSIPLSCHVHTTYRCRMLGPCPSTFMNMALVLPCSRSASLAHRFKHGPTQASSISGTMLSLMQQRSSQLDMKARIKYERGTHKPSSGRYDQDRSCHGLLALLQPRFKRSRHCLKTHRPIGTRDVIDRGIPRPDSSSPHHMLTNK